MQAYQNSFANKSKERLLRFGSLDEDDYSKSDGCTCFQKMSKTWHELVIFSGKVWEMGRSDPRKFIFAIKMGLALAAVSLLLFWKQPFADASQYSIWAILTVIVMFEFSIGATFIKGFNRGLGTFCAAVLAFCFYMLSSVIGQFDEVLIIISIFITGAFSSYLKLYPTMKPYEYGFRVFPLTYCILIAAGNRTGEYIEAVLTRLVLIAFGAFIVLVVNICIYPIWSGDDLYNLVVKNFKSVASSLEGCVNGYLQCVKYERVPSKILTYQASDDPLYNAYRSVVESAGRENDLLDFALWEPPHGRYKTFNYPWRNYVKVSGALRHCAFMVMAMHGCVLAEIQAPAEKRQVFSAELQRVGSEGAKVLREIGSKIEKMEKVSTKDLLQQVHEAAEELQMKIDKKSYLLVNSEQWEGSIPPKVFEDTDNFCDLKDNENKGLLINTLSETVLNIGSVPGLDGIHHISGIETSLSQLASSEDMFRKQPPTWPSNMSINADLTFNAKEAKTYESASSLSLATFASLLIEFVARLQYLVDSFQELSEMADFKEATVDQPAPKEVIGFWRKLFKCF